MRTQRSVLGIRVRAALPLLIAMTLVPTACEEDDATSSGSGAASTSGSGTRAPKVPPCSDASPYKIAANPQWATTIIVCEHPDTSVDIVNVSPAVLLIQAPQALRVGIAPPASPPGDLASAARQVVLSARPAPDGRFQLPAGGTATAVRAGGARQVYLEVDRTLTAETYFADVVAKWAAGKLSRPGETLGRSVASCAREVGELFTSRAGGTGSPPPVDLALVQAIQTGRACKPLAKEVGDLERRPPPAATTFADEVRSISKSFRTALIDDLLKLVRRALL